MNKPSFHHPIGCRLFSHLFVLTLLLAGALFCLGIVSRIRALPTSRPWLATQANLRITRHVDEHLPAFGVIALLSASVPLTTPTVTPSITITPTLTPTATITPTPTATATPTDTPTPEAGTLYLPLIFQHWPPLPDTPSLNAIDNADGDGIFAVHWNQALLADAYTLQEDDNLAFSSPTTVYTGPDDAWSASNKTTGVYYYRVRASNSYGVSDWSIVQAVQVTPPSVLMSSSDATVIEAFGATNFGDTEDMWAGYDFAECHEDEPAYKTTRSLVQFDLSSIPPGTSIIQATLHLRAVNACWIGSGARSVTAYRVKSAWSELGVTWKTQPAKAEAYGSVSIPLDDNVLDWYALDVTNLVRGWVRQQWPNEGLLLIGPERAKGNTVRFGFATREWSEYAPYLSITYSHSTQSRPTAIPSASTASPNCQNTQHGGKVCSVVNDAKKMNR